MKTTFHFTVLSVLTITLLSGCMGNSNSEPYKRNLRAFSQENPQPRRNKQNREGNRALSARSSSGRSAMASRSSSASEVSFIRVPGQLEAKTSLLGANNLYWIDDKPSWGKGLGKELTNVNITALRYPGGEVADNFDWETNSLEYPKVYPQEAKTAQLKSQRIDYLDFLGHAKANGIKDLFFVVNLEGAFMAKGNVDDNIVKYAQKAARWVAEVKRHGYYVKYWEIGNESDLRQTNFPLTATEYAKALNVFYREMKRADPSIQIGALGPKRTRDHGFADSLNAEQLSFFRQNSDIANGQDICERKNKKSGTCAPWIKEQIPGDKEKHLWWDTLLNNANSSFDFAIVHDYEETYDILKKSDELQQLRNYLQQRTGHPVQLSVTEWNDAPSKRTGASVEDAALNGVIKLGNYVAAGVNYAIFWPLRTKDSRSLLSLDTMQPTAIYQALKFINPVLSGSFANQAGLNGDIYYLQTQSAQGKNALLVNRGTQAQNISIKFDTPSATVDVDQLDIMSLKLKNSQNKVNGKIDLVVPARSVIVVKTK